MMTATRLESKELTGWGLRNRGRVQVATPRDADEVASVFTEARDRGMTLGIRGGGNSYGDAALNGGQMQLSTAGLDRILAWDSAAGVITVEPGVTIARLWRQTLPDGWWPAVVPGTSAVTVGGAASSNAHGKNNWRIGCFGDFVLAFDLVLPSGEHLTCSRERNADLFYAAIGGMGLLGCFVSLTLQARRIYSGRLAEVQRPYGSLDAILAAIEEATYWATDIVGWVDTSARGAALGRGLLKFGRDLLPGEDPDARASLTLAAQQLHGGPAARLPSGLVTRAARPMTTRLGVWGANRAQWSRGRRKGARKPQRETYAAANFLLDAIPNWRDVYKPGGLIQHQSFVPREAANSVFAEILRRSQAAGCVPSLAVLKKHRGDDFTLSYLLDGYSLALDYPVQRRREATLLRLMRELNDVLADHGGRVYFAKDSTATAAQVARMYPSARLAEFAALKARYDPDGLLSTDLYRRLLAPEG
jgi:FAD/FMN-containing dehydrogenase